MDIWVVAAAAGAGYVAQHWKDFMKSGTSTSNSSSGRNNLSNLEVSSLTPQLQEEKGHFHMLSRKDAGKEFYKERDPVSNSDATENMPSTSDLDGVELELVNKYKDCDVLSQTCLLPRFLNSYELKDIGESSKPSARKIGSLYNRRILRSRRTNREVIKPINSLQSCLMSQIYKEHAEMEDYILKPGSSLARPTVRQLLVTDGSRVISRASTQANIVQTQIVVKNDRGVSSEEKASVIGVPPLPNNGSSRSGEVKTKKDKGQRTSNYSNSIAAKYINSQGSSHGAILFCFGISIGIMSSLMSCRQEVDKLSALLKQTEDLVQDLQEEIDMKDSLTVKEIVVKDHESQDTHEDTIGKDKVVALSSEQKFGHLTEGHNEDCDEKAQEESRRKIEAELEAELATLELNMTSSTLDAQLSDLLELDEECGPDIAQGEFKANMFGRQAADESYADKDGTGNSTPHMINYAVSPRELSLRLHEVLESRLEERVKELETALQNSVKKNRNVESEHAKSLRQFSNSEAGSSSAQGSPTAIEKNAVDEVVVIHLADDALHAYNEAYDEFTKVNGSEEEGLSSGVETHHQESLRSFYQNLDSPEDGWENHFIPHHSDTSMKASPTTRSQHIADADISPNELENDNDRDNDYDSDEMEKLLIKQILEKTRQGSPAVLNARRILFSLDDD